MRDHADNGVQNGEAEAARALRPGAEVRQALFEAALTGTPLLDVAAANKVSIVAVLKALRGLERQDPEVRQLVQAHSAIVDLEVEGLKSLAVKRLRGLLDADGDAMSVPECRAAELTRRTAVAVLRLTLPERRASAGGGEGGPSWSRDKDEERAAEIFRADAGEAHAMANGEAGDSRAVSVAHEPAGQEGPECGDARMDVRIGPWFEREDREEAGEAEDAGEEIGVAKAEETPPARARNGVTAPANPGNNDDVPEVRWARVCAPAVVNGDFSPEMNLIDSRDDESTRESRERAGVLARAVYSHPP